MRKESEHESPIWYDHDQVSFMDSPKQQHSQSGLTYHYPNYPCKKELDNLHYQIPPPPHHHHQQQFLQLPLLESPKFLPPPPCSSMPVFAVNVNNHVHQYGNNNNNISTNTNQLVGDDQLMDWRVLDKFVASQLSQEEVSKENDYSNAANTLNVPTDDSNLNMVRNLNKQEAATENTSTASSSSQIDMWK